MENFIPNYKIKCWTLCAEYKGEGPKLTGVNLAMELEPLDGNMGQETLAICLPLGEKHEAESRFQEALRQLSGMKDDPDAAQGFSLGAC